MRLKDVESKELLPRFASKMEWVQNAFDDIVNMVQARAKIIDAPLTLDSLSAMTNAELQSLYEQYGVVQYYPDLSRKTREDMIYYLAKIYRYLGTPKSIETLCNYIFDEVEWISIHVVDNLAWNGTTLEDEELLDMFDLIIEINEPEYNPEKNKRIIDNVFRFCRNSQTLRASAFEFPNDLGFKVGIAHGDDAGFGVCYINDDVAEAEGYTYAYAWGNSDQSAKHLSINNVDSIVPLYGNNGQTIPYNASYSIIEIDSEGWWLNPTTLQELYDLGLVTLINDSGNLSISVALNGTNKEFIGSFNSLKYSLS